MIGAARKTFAAPPIAFALIFALALGAAAALAQMPAPAPHAANSPLGLWETVDDKTGRPRALVRIYLENGKYFGRIERSFTPGAESRVCAVCSDSRKDQPIIGLVIIRNMSPRDGEFVGGDILDPDSGSVYRCKFHLENGGAELAVRGFVGISLLGRSQTWLRKE